MDGLMDGQSDRRRDRRKDRWMDGQMDAWIDEQLVGGTDVHMEKWTDGASNRVPDLQFRLWICIL